MARAVTFLCQGTLLCHAGAARKTLGIPGEPPPEPTSTIGPSSARTTSVARSASSSSIARAFASSRSAVSPGVATTARSQSDRKDDDVAIRLRPLGRGLDALELLQLQ